MEYRPSSVDLKKIMPVAVELKDKGFFTPEQYEALAAVYFEQMLACEPRYIFDEEGQQILQSVVDNCTDAHLQATFQSSPVRDALPQSVRKNVEERLAAP